MATAFRVRGGLSTVRALNVSIRGSGFFSQTVTGSLGALAGTCTTAGTFLVTCTGSLSGWISGTLTTLFIAGPNAGINILQRLRKRGDL